MTDSRTFLTKGGVPALHSVARVVLTHPEAQEPKKERPTDVGYDITLVARTENRAEDTAFEVNMFNTGLKLEPPKGHHFELVARSSLHKTGYMLVTGTSIIDPEYTGELLVPLYKFKDGEDIALPFRGLQLIIRPTIHANFVPSKTLPETSRGANGFGSTGFASSSSSRKSGLSLTSASAGSYAPQDDYEDVVPQTRPPRRHHKSAGNHMF